MIQHIKNITLVFILFALVISLSKNILQYQEKQNFLTLFELNLKKEINENKKLKNEILTNQDPVVIEEKIRDNLNLSKKGESIIILPEENIKIIKPQAKIQPSIFIQWWNTFVY